MGKFKRKHVQKSLNKVFSKFERLWEAASADYTNHVKSRLLEYILPSKNLQTLFSSINFSWVPFYLFFFFTWYESFTRKPYVQITLSTLYML